MRAKLLGSIPKNGVSSEGLALTLCDGQSRGSKDDTVDKFHFEDGLAFSI